MKKINLLYLILTSPIFLSCITISPFNIKMVTVQFFVMTVTEIARQWLWSEKAQDLSTDKKRFFFFGAVFNNLALNNFFNASEKKAGEPVSAKKTIAFVLMYGISFFGMKFSSGLGNVNYFHLFILSTLSSIWIYCKDLKALNNLLLINLAGNTIFFLNQEDKNFLFYFIWLVVCFTTNFILQRWIAQKQKSENPDDDVRFYSNSYFVKALAISLIVMITFSFYNFLIPIYEENDIGVMLPENFAVTAESTVKKIAPALENSMLRKKFKIPPDTLENLAKLKMKLSQTDLNRLRLSGSGEKNGAGKKLSSLQSQDQNDLQALRQQLADGEKLSPEDMKKLTELAKNINTDSRQFESSGSDSGSGTPDAPASSANDPSLDQTIAEYERQSQKLTPASQKIEMAKGEPEKDAAAEYTETRNKLANQIDQLMVKDRKNQLLKEEFSILTWLDKFFRNIRKFLFLIILSIIAVWILAKSKIFSQETDLEAGKISLKREVRIRLRDIYKALTSSKLSPADEVIKTYYLVEMAMKEIEFSRPDDLPPKNYLELINKQFPFLGIAVKVPTLLFNRVFYGEKSPSDHEITSLRASLKELMRKLQII
ncbi:MAG: hypothetical protein ACXWQQ_15680 [Pseudobdellovibrio sp.]